MGCLQAHHRRENIFQAPQNNQQERIEVEAAPSSHGPSRSQSPTHSPIVPLVLSPASQDENSSQQEEVPDANTFRKSRSSDEMTQMDPSGDWMDDDLPSPPGQETTHVSSSDRITPKEPKAPYPYKDTSVDGDSNLPSRPVTPESVRSSPERSVTPPSTKPCTSKKSKKGQESSIVYKK